MKIYGLTLDDLMILKDCSSYLSAISMEFNNVGFYVNAKNLYERSAQINSVIDRILATIKEKETKE